MNAVTLYFTPIERGDGIPWSQARIEEAMAPAGPWTLIDTLALTPPDSNPADPQERRLTTSNATLPAGWYRVTFADAMGITEAPSEPVYSGDADISPTVEEVGGLMHARTTQRGGSEVGTFTATSRPTADQVEGMIRQASSLVLASTGAMPTLDDCPDAPNIASAVRTLIAMRATLFIEPSLWPEQTVAGVSPYTAMREQYEAELPRVVDAIRDCRESGAVEPGEAGGAEGGPADASYWFPPGAGYDVVVW
jgi:hypothetical protein